MKETKKFFENNRLNRGYTKIANYNQNDMGYIRSKFQHILPPIDMMEEYEEMYPGTFAKLLDMVEREQNHRHSLDLVMQEKYSRANALGRYFALILTGLIAFTTLVLVLLGAEIAAAAFAIAAFSCVYLISKLYSGSAAENKARPSKPPQRYNRSSKKRHSQN